LQYLDQAMTENLSLNRINGIKQAAKENKYKGRKSEIDGELLLELDAQNIPPKNIASILGCSEPSVFRIKRKLLEDRKDYTAKFCPARLEVLVLGSLKVFVKKGATFKQWWDVTNSGLDQLPEFQGLEWFFNSPRYKSYFEADYEEAMVLIEDDESKAVARQGKVLEAVALYGPPEFSPDRAVYLADKGLELADIAKHMGIPEKAVRQLLMDRNYKGKIVQSTAWKMLEKIESGGIASLQNDPKLQAFFNDPLDSPFED
jgi:DNA-binding Lrp family transcriptional regulator